MEYHNMMVPCMKREQQRMDAGIAKEIEYVHGWDGKARVLLHGQLEVCKNVIVVLLRTWVHCG